MEALCSSTYLVKYKPFVNLPLFILWFDSLGTGVNNTFNKNLIFFALEKVLRFIFFANKNVYAIPPFIDENILPISFLYFKSISYLLYCSLKNR